MAKLICFILLAMLYTFIFACVAYKEGVRCAIEIFIVSGIITLLLEGSLQIVLRG